MFVTLDTDFTAVVGPNCTYCSYGNLLKNSLAKGFLEVTNPNVEVKEISRFIRFKNKVYLHGRWGLESIALNNGILDITYGMA